MTGRGTYIKREGVCSFRAHLMASTCSYRLDDFCREKNLSFFELKLQCIFCRHYCSLTDLAEFHEKVLSIVYRDGLPYAACNNCLCFTAKAERERYFQCSCRFSILDAVVGVPVETITVRCLLCLALLNFEDKIRCTASNEEAYLVRGHWRATCNKCKSL